MAAHDHTGKVQQRRGRGRATSSSASTSSTSPSTPSTSASTSSTSASSSSTPVPRTRLLGPPRKIEKYQADIFPGMGPGGGPLQQSYWLLDPFLQSNMDYLRRMTDNLTLHVGVCLARLMRHDPKIKIGVWGPFGKSPDLNAPGIIATCILNGKGTQKVDFTYKQIESVIRAAPAGSAQQVKIVFQDAFRDTGLVFGSIKKILSKDPGNVEGREFAERIYRSRNLIAHGGAIDSSFPTTKDIKDYFELYERTFAFMIEFLSRTKILSPEAHSEATRQLTVGKTNLKDIFTTFNEASVLKGSLNQIRRPHLTPEAVKLKLNALVDQCKDCPDVLEYLAYSVPARIRSEQDK